MRKLYFALILLCYSGSLLAQDDPFMFDYRTQAITYQQSIKAAQKGIEGADSKVDAAQAGFYPRIDAKGDFQYFATPIQLGANENSPTGDQLES